MSSFYFREVVGLEIRFSIRLLLLYSINVLTIMLTVLVCYYEMYSLRLYNTSPGHKIVLKMMQYGSRGCQSTHHTRTSSSKNIIVKFPCDAKPEAQNLKWQP